jgi:hypothetical protein
LGEWFSPKIKEERAFVKGKVTTKKIMGRVAKGLQKIFDFII